MKAPLVELVFEQVTADPVLGTPVVVLREKGGSGCVPLWVEDDVARSVLSALRGLPMARPSTYDLIGELLFRLRAQVERVSVTDLVEGTFFAVLELRSAEGSIRLDARPSDAVALALRVGCPIFASADVVERAWSLATLLDVEAGEAPAMGPRPIHDEAAAAPEGYLDSLADEDFGKWKM